MTKFEDELRECFMIKHPNGKFIVAIPKELKERCYKQTPDFDEKLKKLKIEVIYTTAET